MEKEKLALGGSVLSAITASLCCIGPLVAVIVGASGFAAAGLFAQSRPLFLTITALMLAAARYLTYRHPKADHCSAEGCPQNPVAKWNKVILWLATAFVIAIAAFPIYSGMAARLLVAGRRVRQRLESDKARHTAGEHPFHGLRSMRSGHSSQA